MVLFEGVLINQKNMVSSSKDLPNGIEAELGPCPADWESLKNMLLDQMYCRVVQLEDHNFSPHKKVAGKISLVMGRDFQGSFLDDGATPLQNLRLTWGNAVNHGLIKVMICHPESGEAILLEIRRYDDGKDMIYFPDHTDFDFDEFFRWLQPVITNADYTVRLVDDQREYTYKALHLEEDERWDTIIARTTTMRRRQRVKDLLIGIAALIAGIASASAVIKGCHLDDHHTSGYEDR